MPSYTLRVFPVSQNRVRLNQEGIVFNFDVVEGETASLVELRRVIDRRCSQYIQAGFQPILGYYQYIPDHADPITSFFHTDIELSEFLQDEHTPNDIVVVDVPTLEARRMTLSTRYAMLEEDRGNLIDLENVNGPTIRLLEEGLNSISPIGPSPPPEGLLGKAQLFNLIEQLRIFED